LEAGKKLARKYNVDQLLQPILEFNPAEDNVGTKPALKRLPRPKSSEEFDIIGTIEYPHIKTPVRSRVASAATPGVSPTRAEFGQQEPTPHSKEYIREREFVLPTTLTKRLFDEENAQRDFFDSVYARKRTRTSESYIESEEHEIPVVVTKFTSKEERKQMIMMHIFVEEDSEYNTLLFDQLIKDEQIESGYDLEIKLDDSNGTLLHWAAAYGRISLVELLISKGMKVNVRSDGDITPLMHAIDSVRNYSNKSMDRLLNLLGESLFSVDSEGRTALHYVNHLCRFRSKQQMSAYYMECIAHYIEDARLASKSPFIGFVDLPEHKTKSTALHIACHYRCHKNAAMLIRLGAAKTLENSKGETAISLSANDYRLLYLMVS
jgi:hypothetical protein